MADQEPKKTTSKIVMRTDDSSPRRSAADRGQVTHSLMGIIGCVLPVFGAALTYVLGWVVAGGNEAEPVYAAAIVLLVFFVGLGAGLGVGALSHPRRFKLTGVLAIVLNGLAIIFLLLASMSSAGEPTGPNFTQSEGGGSAAVMSVDPGVGQ